MRGRLSELSFWGVLLALGVSGAASGCALTPLDPDDEEVGQVQAELDQQVDAPETGGTNGPTDTEDDGADPNPVPWKDSAGDEPLGSDGFEPNPVPWRPPGTCDPTTTTSTRGDVPHDH